MSIHPLIGILVFCLAMWAVGVILLRMVFGMPRDDSARRARLASKAAVERAARSRL